MKPTSDVIRAAAEKFGRANIPGEFMDELLPELVDVCLTALVGEKPCARAFQRRKGDLRIEMKASLVRTPHTTLSDSIRLEFHVVSVSTNVLLP